MARPLFSDVTALARQIADDRDVGAGVVWADADLYLFGSSVQRQIWKRFTERGLEDVNVFATKTITSSDSAITFTTPTSNTLPDDFIRPIKLWEKASGADDATYILMSNTSERLPDEPSAATIRYWVFEDGTSPNIKFIAPTATRTVRMLYYREPVPITTAATALYMGGTIDAMAFGLLAMMAASRGEAKLATFWNNKFEQQVDGMLLVASKTTQRRHRKRLPYSLAKRLT